MLYFVSAGGVPQILIVPVIGVLKVGIEKYMFFFVCEHGSPDPPVEGHALHILCPEKKRYFLQGPLILLATP